MERVVAEVFTMATVAPSVLLGAIIVRVVVGADGEGDGDGAVMVERFCC